MCLCVVRKLLRIKKPEDVCICLLFTKLFSAVGIDDRECIIYAHTLHTADIIHIRALLLLMQQYIMVLS